MVTQWPYHILPRIISWCLLVSLASLYLLAKSTGIASDLWLRHHLHSWVPCACAKSIVGSSGALDGWWIRMNVYSIRNLNVGVHIGYDVTECGQPALQLDHLGAKHRVLGFCCSAVLVGDVQCCEELLFRRPQLVHLFFYAGTSMFNFGWWQNKILESN